MPLDDPQSRGRQPLTYNSTSGWFAALGIPITPTDDGSRYNPYPLLEISAHNSPGQQLASLDVVVPVATETECRGCHVTGGVASTRGGIIWANDADTEVQSKKNILRLHDAVRGTNYRIRLRFCVLGATILPLLI